jgi:hypothetical protein
MKQAIGNIKILSRVYDTKKPEPNDSGKPSSGDTNILTLSSFGQDGRYWGLNKENRIASQLFFMPLSFIQTFGLIQFTA